MMDQVAGRKSAGHEDAGHRVYRDGTSSAYIF